MGNPSFNEIEAYLQRLWGFVHVRTAGSHKLFVRKGDSAFPRMSITVFSGGYGKKAAPHFEVRVLRQQLGVSKQDILDWLVGHGNQGAQGGAQHGDTLLSENKTLERNSGARKKAKKAGFCR